MSSASSSVAALVVAAVLVASAWCRTWCRWPHTVRCARTLLRLAWPRPSLAGLVLVAAVGPVAALWAVQADVLLSWKLRHLTRAEVPWWRVDA